MTTRRKEKRPDRERPSSSRSRAATRRRPGASGTSTRASDAVQRLATECVELAVGLEACARYARDPRTAEAARSLAAVVRELSDHAWWLGASLGHERHRGPRTCERLRWEWLASTAALLDGSPDARLVAECERLATRAGEDARAAELAAGDEPLRRAAHAIAVALERARRGLAAA